MVELDWKLQYFRYGAIWIPTGLLGPFNRVPRIDSTGYQEFLQQPPKGPNPGALWPKGPKKLFGLPRDPKGPGLFRGQGALKRAQALKRDQAGHKFH